MATKALNEMLASPMALVGAAFIEDAADQLEQQAEKTGSARIHEATILLARRLAKLMREAGGEE